MTLNKDGWVNATGKIIDTKGQPLQGITVKGSSANKGYASSIGTRTTKADGTFRFDHPRPSTDFILDVIIPVVVALETWSMI